MTAFTGKKDVRYQQGTVLSFPQAAVNILEGALVSVNAAGYLTNASDTANDLFIGVAEHGSDNSAGNAGDLEVRVRLGGVVNAVVGSTITIANVGDLVYAVDNQTVDLAAVTTNDIPVGRIIQFVGANAARVILKVPNS